MRRNLHFKNSGFEKCGVMMRSACGLGFFFLRGERIEIPSDFQLVLSIYSFGRPSTSFVPARKNHFLLPLSKITLPERDDSMQEHFKQRHCSNSWSNKLIWSVTIQLIVWSMVHKWFLQLRYCCERCYVFISEVSGIRRNLLPWY